MKHYLPLVLALAACGGQAEDFEPEATPALREYVLEGFDTMATAPEHDEELTDEEKIFMPNNYGHQGGGFNKCSNPFVGDCMVPDVRTLTLSVHKFTCSEAVFKGAIGGAANHIRDIANSKGWNVTVQVLDTNATGSSQWIIKCANNGPPGQGGVTSISESVGFLWDCHDTDRGHLCQYKRATSIINENVLKAAAPWNTASFVQRSNWAGNVAIHEAGHMFGFGHPATAGTTVMNSGGGLTLDSWWTTLKTYTTDEKFQLDCYNESSGTGSGC